MQKGTCSSCRAETDLTQNFCCHCGAHLGSNVASGDKSLNIAGNPTFEGNTILIGGSAASTDNEKRAEIDRSHVWHLSLAGKPVKTPWVIFSGVVSFVGSVASIYALFGTLWTHVSILFMAASAFLVALGFILLRHRFMKLGPINVEADQSQSIFLSRISGTCPNCKGDLRLRSIRVAKDTVKTFVRCKRNPDHTWNFDPTIFG